MVIVHQIDAGAAVPTLVQRTVVQVLGARHTAPALLALALEAARRIVAGQRIDARPQRPAGGAGPVLDDGALVEICDKINNVKNRTNVSEIQIMYTRSLYTLRKIIKVIIKDHPQPIFDHQHRFDNQISLFCLYLCDQF